MNKLQPYGGKIYSLKWEKMPDHTSVLKCDVGFDIKYSRDEIACVLNDFEEVKSFDLP